MSRGVLPTVFVCFLFLDAIATRSSPENTAGAEEHMHCFSAFCCGNRHTVEQSICRKASGCSPLVDCGHLGNICGCTGHSRAQCPEGHTGTEYCRTMQRSQRCNVVGVDTDRPWHARIPLEETSSYSVLCSRPNPQFLKKRWQQPCSSHDVVEPSHDHTASRTAAFATCIEPGVRE